MRGVHVAGPANWY